MAPVATYSEQPSKYFIKEVEKVKYAKASYVVILAPLCTDSHWALLVIRRASIESESWEAKLLDSRLREAMKEQVHLALKTLSMALELPFGGAQLRIVDVPEQDNSWECGHRAATHARQAMQVPLTTPLCASHFPYLGISGMAAAFAQEYASAREQLQRYFASEPQA